MAAEFIEVTTAVLVPGSGITAGAKQLVAISQIVKIIGAPRNTSVIVLTTGKTVDTMESYDDLKRRLGVVN
jgi:hypothetical protein